MNYKYLVMLVFVFTVLSCHHRVGQNDVEPVKEKQVVESEPIKIDVPVDDSKLDIDNIDLSVSKRLETNFNICLKNRLFTMTLTNEIDEIMLGNTPVPGNFCEETTFSCGGTDNLNLTNARIVICPTK
ncbi:MAG: hypothetical protein GWO07_06895 [Candidatus Dadabacteria bacterium]|nr:hypothetical protein [Candidatus Dadabacteria bacterium]NIS08477.1 hypothetical protein [Candidatus Dadabacteria bacterium]NIY21965.1 hypothetical protein [Candidatus Dadabacteria bacterium]